VVAVGDRLDGDGLAVSVAGLDVDQPLPVAGLEAVLVEVGPFPVAVLRDGEHPVVVVVVDGRHAGDRVPLAKVDPDDAPGGPAHRARLRLVEADRHPVPAPDDDVVLAVRHLDVDELVAVLQPDRADARGPDVAELIDGGPLDVPVAGDHRQELVVVEVVGVHHRLDLLAVTEVEEVDRRLPAGRSGHLRDLVRLQLVDLAAVGEDEQVVVGVGGEHGRDAVGLLQPGTDDPLPAAVLRPEGVQRHPLDVVVLAHHDDALFLRDEVFVGDVAGVLDEARAALVAVLVFHLPQFVDDHGVEFVGVREDDLQPLDPSGHVLVLGLDLLGLHRGERPELHADDVGRLRLRELVLRLQRGLRGVAVVGVLDRLDHVVDLFERLQPPFEDVRAVLPLGELVLGAPAHDLAAVVDVVSERLF